MQSRAVPRLELVRQGVPDRSGKNPFTRQPLVISGRKEKRSLLEIEVRENRVETWSSDENGVERRATSEFATNDQAQAAYVARVSRAVRKGFHEVGECEVLGTGARHGGSLLLLDELFAAGDERVTDEILGAPAEKKLASLAAPWMSDARPAMRRALLAYIDDGCDRYHHKVLVKRLYKLAEGRGDDELLAHFLVAFDRLSHRRIAFVSDWRARARVRRLIVADPLTRDRLGHGKSSARFSRATRRYLARRAFRYFRRLGKADPARYGRGIRLALALYEDRHLDAPERLLDAWGLLHALYAWSPVLDRQHSGVRVAEGKQLSELVPAPYWPAAWRGVEDEVFQLVANAKCRTVRAWSVAWLKKEYPSSLDAVPVARVVLLLESPHEESITLGAELLGRTTGLATVTVDVWRKLLSIGNIEALLRITAAFEKHVAPERVTFAECIELAMSRAAPVAELGLRWATDRAAKDVDLAIVARLATAPLDSVRGPAVRWLLGLLDAAPERRGLILRDLLDARFVDVRVAATEYVEQRHAEVGLPLWLSLLESPYDDVRALVVRHATRWEAEVGPDEMRHVAATVILAVHRGASAKQTMLRRIAERVARKPDEADRLLPVLALALRSVRATERTGALLAIARAALSDPSLRDAVSRHFPDVVIDTRVSA